MGYGDKEIQILSVKFYLNKFERDLLLYHLAELRIKLTTDSDNATVY